MIPIDRIELFARMDKDKAEIKKEINDVALLILAKFNEPIPTPKIEIKTPKILIQPMTKKK